MTWAPEAQNVDGCWVWSGGKTSDGYGQFRGEYVHRSSYTSFVGTIPAGYQIDHLCRNRACYNPAHLEAVTQAENVRRQPNVAAQMERTHCASGHPLDGTRTKKNGSVIRRCLTCHRERELARYRAKAVIRHAVDA